MATGLITAQNPVGSPFMATGLSTARNSVGSPFMATWLSTAQKPEFEVCDECK